MIPMISKIYIIAIFRGIFDISRYYARDYKLCGSLRKTANFATFRVKRQISQYRTHRDKYLPLSAVMAVVKKMLDESLHDVR